MRIFGWNPASAEEKAALEALRSGDPQKACASLRPLIDYPGKLSGDKAWSSAWRTFADIAERIAGPELAALARAVEVRDWTLADRICERMAWAQAPMFPGGKLENFVDYNIPIAHARLEGSGLVKSGPPRPPYIFAPEGHLAGGRETGRRWASLRSEF